jgi:hypothetical protein
MASISQNGQNLTKWPASQKGPTSHKMSYISQNGQHLTKWPTSDEMAYVSQKLQNIIEAFVINSQYFLVQIIVIMHCPN